MLARDDRSDLGRENAWISVTRRPLVVLFYACLPLACSPPRNDLRSQPISTYPNTAEVQSLREDDYDDAQGRDDAKRRPHLLYLLADPDWPKRTALAACDRLTIEEYRNRGTTVTELGYADLNRWLDGEGRSFSKAHPNFQYVAFAKAHRADAIGGLSYWEVSKKEAAQYNFEHGFYIHSWCIFLSGCSHNFIINMTEGTRGRAIPLDLLGGGYSVPKEIVSQSCSVPSGDTKRRIRSRRTRPFLGLSLNDKGVSKILPGSPVEKAGLLVGDQLVSIGGKPVQAMSDVVKALEGLLPGTGVDIEYLRNGVASEKRVTLADYDAFFEERSPRGKPVPDLVGTDIKGREVRLADMKGKVLLLDFWATWCGPCMEDLPLQQLLWDRIKDKKFVWVSVSVDEDEQVWRDFVRHNKLGGVQLRNSEWAAALGVRGYPTVLLIDNSGIVQCELRGSAIAQAVMALLSEEQLHSTTPVDEATAIDIARRAVAANDTWAERATYEPNRKGNGWSVVVWRIQGYDDDGKAQFVPGGHRLVLIDQEGNVTAYIRGK